MLKHHMHVRDTVLLSGWLFADLLLGLMVIFLMAIPGIPPNITPPPILKVDKTSLSSSDCSKQSNSTYNCSIAISEDPSSKTNVTWEATSDISDSVTFNPATTTLTTRDKPIPITIANIPCQSGSFIISGAHKLLE